MIAEKIMQKYCDNCDDRDDVSEDMEVILMDDIPYKVCMRCKLLMATIGFEDDRCEEV